MNIQPQLEKRNICIVLGSGAGDLNRFGFKIGRRLDLDLVYSDGTSRHYKYGKTEVYEAEVGGVPVYLLSRHSSEGGYIPAYRIDHTANLLPLIDERGAGTKVILGSSLVGGCRTTDWQVGDIVLVRDGIDMHPNDFYVDGNKPYIHAHNLFDREISNLLHQRGLQRAARGDIMVRDGGVYYSGPDTTKNRFETKAEMQRLLAPAYLRKAIERLAERMGVDPRELFDKYMIDDLQPNLVGMTLVREAGQARALSTRRADEYQPRFAGFAVVSDFPEEEETNDDKNAEIALAKLPVIMEVFAEAIPEIDRRLKEGSL